MVTHETPGDTFWDRIRAGAEQAAKDTGSTLKYSADPDATKQAVLIQNAIDSKVDGIATTLVTPDALIPTVQKAVASRHSRGQLQLRPRLLQAGWALLPTSPPTRRSPVRQAGKRIESRRRPPRSSAPSSRPGRWPLRIAVPGVKDSFPNTENIQVNGAGRLRRHFGDPGQADRRTRTSTGSSPSARRKAMDALKAFERSGSSGQGRHLRPRTRRRRRL